MTVHDLRRPHGRPPSDRPADLLHRAGDLSGEPPPEVWDGVVRALADDPTGRPRRSTWGRRSTSRHRSAGWSLGAGSLLVAAAAGALLATGGHWLLDGGASDDSGQVLAAAGLGPVLPAGTAGDEAGDGGDGGGDRPDGADGTVASAHAEIVDVDGRRVLRIDLDGVEVATEAADPATGAPTAYLEVWLLRPDVSGMVTLGVLEGGRAELVLPEGVSLEEYPVVDVSVEAVDGDPAHGGRSVLRGQLTSGQALTALGP